MTAFIYVMPERNGSRCKVGRSINPAARLKRVRSEWCADVWLFATVSCDGCDPEQMECAAHAYLARHGLHAHHEWFTATPQQALWAIYKGRKHCLMNYHEDGSLLDALRLAPPDTAFPLFHNEVAGYVYLPVWRSNWGVT